jgi:Putative Actinobacterial Holin-X, holin superfamily III
MEPVPELTDEPAKQPTLVALLGQLADDTREFARAEIAFLKAQTGERVGHAVPGVVAILVAVTMAFALIVAIIVTAMMALAAIWGAVIAILAVSTAVLLIAGFVGWWGTGRVRGALKAREVR